MTTATIEVPTTADNVLESDEVFNAMLLTPMPESGGRLSLTTGAETAQGTILNDDSKSTVIANSKLLSCDC